MSNTNNNFIFEFDDHRQLSMPQKLILGISPSFYEKHFNTSKKNLVIMPKSITYEDLSNFFSIYKNYLIKMNSNDLSSHNNIIIPENINISKIIAVSEFFETSAFSLSLINENILNPNHINNNLNMISKDNSLDLLILSYNKLHELNEKRNNNNRIEKISNIYTILNNDEEADDIWLDLFIKSLEVSGQNLLSYFQENENSENDTENIKKLKKYDRKIIDELYEKFAFNMINRNYIISQNKNEVQEINTNPNVIDINLLKKIIDFLMEKRNQKDFFGLLSNEFMKIISEENLNEINNLPNPTFLLKIDINELNSYYEEFPLNYISNPNFNDTKDKKIIFVVFYKKLEDTLNVALKLSRNKNSYASETSFDIMTYLSLVYADEINTKQVNVKSLSNNKTMYDILKINNFKKIFLSKNKDKDTEYITLKIFLKPCYIHSMLCSYFYYNLDSLCTNKNITKISKNLLSIIISQKQLITYNNFEKKQEEKKYNNMFNNIIITLINWLEDEINIKEDITEIIESIKWENVSLSLIFEFIIKYSHNISTEDIEFIFTNSIYNKLKKINGNLEYITKYIINSLFLSCKNINYIKIFCENKKLTKFNNYEQVNRDRYSNTNNYINLPTIIPNITTNNSTINNNQQNCNDSYGISNNNNNNNVIPQVLILLVILIVFIKIIIIMLIKRMKIKKIFHNIL